MFIRKERPNDRKMVFAVNAAAFDTDAEAKLVDALREQADPVISLVAEEEKKIVGHIIFSPVTISGHPELKLTALGPMAVLPEYQQTGVGSRLIETGLTQCQEQGFGAVVVLGHAEYYPRFGFSPARQFDIKCEYDVPAEVFMLKELTTRYLDGKSGTVTYHEAFNDV